VRVPAALCGVYGIRPTHGRIDFSGAMAMAPSFDVAGWFASGPGVFRAVGAVLLDGPRLRDTIRNLVILDDAFAEADGDVAALLRSALDAMADELPKPAVDRAAHRADSIRGGSAFVSSRRAKFGSITGASSSGTNRNSGQAYANEWRPRHAYRIVMSNVHDADRRTRANGSAAWPIPERSSVFRPHQVLRRCSPRLCKISNLSACASCA
jgi:Amidase